MVEIANTAAEHIESFHAALDVVARERKYLTMLEAFPLPETRDFVLNMIKQRNPHIVATEGDRVVGWCDITRHFFPSHAHRGSLAIGIIPDYRGQGLGRRLITAALEKARQENFVRVELSVHADNSRAITLYEKTGFVTEGVLRRSVCIDGRYVDTICMAVMLDGQ
ncbi:MULTISPECIES: GNAT family N-acetyltransferase [unclassified Mesorhizobium]|uniref:GNAT family N-acetyltransferase n=1 Tax=unclassified Mesorhizobium TaxID=325217 RepID=UPI0003CEB464|nr:GNAT family N-acetyltransferase [Mesorhizobium sp. LSHC420B00]ESX80096.1 acetyltransferase [Mesorhizobium sp. LSHC420B00]